jgi:hypothetical protein
MRCDGENWKSSRLHRRQRVRSDRLVNYGDPAAATSFASVDLNHYACISIYFIDDRFVPDRLRSFRVYRPRHFRSYCRMDWLRRSTGTNVCAEIADSAPVKIDRVNGCHRPHGGNRGGSRSRPRDHRTCGQHASSELFEQQDHANRESVLLPDAGVSAEEGSMIGEQFAKPRRQTT